MEADADECRGASCAVILHHERMILEAIRLPASSEWGRNLSTHVKLSPPEGKPIDTFIINGVECEPYLFADHRLMLEEPDKVLNGARVAMRSWCRQATCDRGEQAGCNKAMEEKAPEIRRVPR